MGDQDLRALPLDDLRRMGQDPPADPVARTALAAELHRRAALARGQAATPPPAVRVVDIDMPFLGMVVFMVKWALASIPALIVLFVIGWALALLTGGMVPLLLRALLPAR